MIRQIGFRSTESEDYSTVGAGSKESLNFGHNWKVRSRSRKQPQGPHLPDLFVRPYRETSYFTAPMVRPRTRCFEAIRAKTITGMTIRVLVAIIFP